jgi:hypothetical protein
VADSQDFDPEDTIPPVFGVGGYLVPAPYGPITCLRPLTRGFEVQLEPSKKEIRIGRAYPPDVHAHLPFASVSWVHATLFREDDQNLRVFDEGSKNGTVILHRGGLPQRIWQHEGGGVLQVGHRLCLGEVEMMPLDDRLQHAAHTVTEWLPPDDHRGADAALGAVIDTAPLVIPHSDRDAVLPLLRVLHAASSRRTFPLTCIDVMPTELGGLDETFTRAGCGMLVVDLRRRRRVPPQFAEALFSPKYHLWPVFVGQSLKRVYKLFGEHRRQGQPWELPRPFVMLDAYPPRRAEAGSIDENAPDSSSGRDTAVPDELAIARARRRGLPPK